MNTFTHRAVDDLVTIVSDKPLHGPSAPQSSRAMTPAEAIEFFVPILGVPNLAQVSWSEDWEPPSQGGGEGTHVSVNGLRGDQIEEFERITAEIALRDYGVGPGVEMPHEHRGSFRADLIAARSRIRRR
jgi:hypothetical protein